MKSISLPSSFPVREVLTRRQFLRASTTRAAGAAVWAGVAFRGVVRAADEGWKPLFNGRNFDGWTPKFTGSELGVNFNDTYRVKDGMIQVSYDRYARFGGQFGHLFYERPFSHYIVRAEYRFVGEQCKDGPGWAFRNSGIMVHCQPPATLRKD